MRIHKELFGAIMHYCITRAADENMRALATHRPVLLDSAGNTAGYGGLACDGEQFIGKHPESLPPSAWLAGSTCHVIPDKDVDSTNVFQSAAI
jgi:hypothetical protein